MESSPEVTARRAALEREAPIVPRSVWKRARLGDKEVVFLCGTIGAEFDAWQRRLSVLSAADALLSQQIGLAAVEKVMDELESKAKSEVEVEGRKLLPRKSPGYGDLPLAIQKDFLATLETGKRIGLAMTEGNMLTPVKSVTAIIGLRDITKEEELRRLRDILGSGQEINAELSVGNCAKGACEGCAMAAKCHQKDN